MLEVSTSGNVVVQGPSDCTLQRIPGGGCPLFTGGPAVLPVYRVRKVKEKATVRLSGAAVNVSVA